MDFDLEIFSQWLIEANTEYIWLGFNSRPKQVFLNEPSVSKVNELVKLLKENRVQVLPRCEKRGVIY